MQKRSKRENDILNERYLRQLRVKGWSQSELENSSVLIAGIGGLGSITSMYLTAAGVGRLVLCDPGVVERQHLNRQVLYTEVSLGALKAEVARARLSALNPDVEIEIFTESITAENIRKIANKCDIIIDGLDNQAARHIVNSHCVKKEIPYIYGAVNGWEGIIGVFKHPETSCLACVSSPRKRFIDSVSAPVAGAAAAAIGSFQTSEALKILMGMESCLSGKLLIVDTKCMKFDTINVEKNKECQVCSKHG